MPTSSSKDKDKAKAKAKSKGKASAAVDSGSGTEATTAPATTTATATAAKKDTPSAAQPQPHAWAVATAYQILSSLYILAWLQVLVLACKKAYQIRLYAIEEYGRVIHEFDPYFNYRATEYLWEHGASKFFQWFDYMSWYPLGRPVGTTIYPGMQFTAVWIKRFLLPDWSINDICCFMPAWFGSIATVCTAAVCYFAVDSVRATVKHESTPALTGIGKPIQNSTSILQDIPGVAHLYVYIIKPIARWVRDMLLKFTNSTWGLPTLKHPPALESAVCTAGFMSIVPAHLLRSVGGGYDNESVATTAMELTFALWVLTLSVRSETVVVLMGILTGVAYFYMVAAWGGYIFVLNLIGAHAGTLLLLLKFTPPTFTWSHLYKSYTSFYMVGTLLAMQVPVVGWTPLKSLEQLGPCAVFLGMQVLQALNLLENRYAQKVGKWRIRLYVIVVCLLASLPLGYYLYSIGYIGPISSRVRGLFVKHTKTGNPLVDSVAEHQAASAQAYYQYLHIVSQLAPYGAAIVALLACTPAASFLLWYAATTYFFSTKMVRLILLTAPIASICGGILLGYTAAWMAGILFQSESGDTREVLFPRPALHLLFASEISSNLNQTFAEPEPTTSKRNGKTSDNVVGTKIGIEKSSKLPSTGDPLWVRVLRLIVSYYIIREAIPHFEGFRDVAEQMARSISHPTIITKGRNQHTGETVIVDDYREAYLWLRDNTPEDARIMAWWDYGYQITGIANRTTIADGNTWNHEHIALLGRALTSSEKEGHRIARHLADYVLIWAGGGGDDVAKSPHLKRIANSVYRGLCSEPTCRTFGMMGGGKPSPQLAESMLYKLHSHNLVPGVQVDMNRFRPVFRSKYGKVRIFKVMAVSNESKEWVEKNRVCDAPGSWFCRGQYPPGLQKILKEKKDFRQLEDFNRKDHDDSDYQKQYFENLNKRNNPSSSSSASSSASSNQPKEMPKRLSDKEIEEYNKQWDNTEYTTLMWNLISGQRLEELYQLVLEQPEIVHVRSADGRGPMWWAYEHNRPRMIQLFKYLGVSDQRKDKNGIRPVDLAQ